MLQVLKAQDPNVITITDSPTLSPLKRPEPPAHAPTVTNIEIDAGSSSFIETAGKRNSKQIHIEEEFFQYTNTMKGPRAQVRIRLKINIVTFFHNIITGLASRRIF